MGFPTKNDHFVVFRGYHHLRKHPYDHPQPGNPSFPQGFSPVPYALLSSFGPQDAVKRKPLGWPPPPSQSGVHEGA